MWMAVSPEGMPLMWRCDHVLSGCSTRPCCRCCCPSSPPWLLLLIGDPSGVSAQGGGHDDARLRWRRRLSMASMLLGAFMAASLVWHAAQGELLVYQLGEWPAPFGIVLVVDRLSALMVLLTYAVAVPAMWYATGGWDTRGRHFPRAVPVPAHGPVRRLPHG